MERKVLSQLTMLDPSEGSDGHLVLKFPSDLSYDNAQGLADEIGMLVTHRPDKLILDMANVDSVDSSGLRTLIGSRGLCEQAGIGFELRSITRCVARTLHVSGLSHTFGLPREDSVVRINVPPADDLDTSPWRTYEYVAASEPAVISVLRDKTAQAAAEAGARDDLLCDVQIAVGEALTNAYRHGSPNKGTDKIRLRCLTCPKAMVVEVEDEGEPFDPNATAEPDPKQMRDHGWEST